MARDESESDEEYIEMEVMSWSPISPSSSSSSSSINLNLNGEFEFQMCCSVVENRGLDSSSSTVDSSPADELFYKGNLLPLHLPPRLQLLHSLLLQSPPPNPLLNITTSADQHMLLSLEEEEDRRSKNSPSLSSWGKRLRQSVIGRKIKSSRAYLVKKGLLLFKPQNDRHPKTEEEEEEEEEEEKKGNRTEKRGKSSPFGRIENYERFQCGSSNSSSTLKKRIDKEMAEEEECSRLFTTNYMCRQQQQRKSFSGAIQCHRHVSSSKSPSASSSSSTTSSSSSSFSVTSNRLYYQEIENSIQGAIAHCNQSRHHPIPNNKINSHHLNICV